MVSRSEAGKRAWAKKSPGEKQRIIARLRGLRGGAKKKGASTMAKGKSNGKKSQGIVSWITNVVALVIGMSDVFMRVGTAMGTGIHSPGKGYKLAWLADALIGDYTGYNPGYYKPSSGVTTDGWKAGSWDPKRMLRGYAPIGGAIGFKLGMGELQKRVKIRSIIPRLGA